MVSVLASRPAALDLILCSALPLNLLTAQQCLYSGQCKKCKKSIEPIWSWHVANNYYKKLCKSRRMGVVEGGGGGGQRLRSALILATGSRCPALGSIAEIP